MEKAKLDTLDKEIIHLLIDNGRMSIGEMTKKLNVTAPTIRSRIKNLEEKGLFKVSGLIDPDRHHEMITALVAISVRASEEMDRLLNKISRLPNVAWAGVVTGRYDIMAQVVCVKGKEELYRFTTETILKMGDIIRSETFILMRSRNNWIRLPEGVDEV
jgi:Lrp/AsnC family transcriptional regulator for asnA, asnC and gidA